MWLGSSSKILCPESSSFQALKLGGLEISYLQLPLASKGFSDYLLISMKKWTFCWQNIDKLSLKYFKGIRNTQFQISIPQKNTFNSLSEKFMPLLIVGHGWYWFMMVIFGQNTILTFLKLESQVNQNQIFILGNM